MERWTDAGYDKGPGVKKTSYHPDVNSLWRLTCKILKHVLFMDQMQLKTVITNNKQGGLISEGLGPGGDSWQSGYYWKEVNDGWDLQMLVFMQSL